MGKILGFSAKLVRLNFLFVEPFGRPGGRFVGVMYFCPQRGSYVGGSHAAGSKVQLSNNTKNLYGANPFPPTRLRTAGGFDTTDSTRGRLRFTTFFNPHASWCNAIINHIVLFNNRENPDTM